MGMLIDTIISHPYGDIVVFLSAAGALSFLLFLAGFLAGLPQLFTISMHAEHLAHARTRAVWGVILMIFFFVLWEAVRFVAGLFT